jgi:hypothetical protein
MYVHHFIFSCLGPITKSGSNVKRGLLIRYSHKKGGGYPLLVIIFYFLFYLETEGRHTNAKAHEVVDHLTSFMLGREEVSKSGLEPPTILIHVCTPFHIFLA